MIKNAIAIIPARGGSKGLPKKNIANLGGKPLIAWSIEASLKCKYINRVVVSSDDLEILNISKEIGAEAYLRKDELASDTAQTLPVIIDVVKNLDGVINDMDYIVIVQPTSPLRLSKHLDEAFEHLLSANASSLISVVKPKQNPHKAFSEENGYIRGLVNDEYPFKPRQMLPEAFYSNGAIYIIETEKLVENESLLTDKCIPYFMDQQSSIDIDTIEDLKLAEAIIESTVYS